MNKIIVYTTNLGGYDDLHESPKVLFNNRDKFRYLYYTDGEAPAGWEKMEMPSGGRKESRFYKINSHLLPEHNISIYLDASYEFKKPIKVLPEFLGSRDIAICPHPHETLEKHANVCIALGLDTEKNIRPQVERYKGLISTPLTENSLIIRKNNATIKELNELWWKEYQAGSCRDQISLPYALSMTGARLKVLPFSARENKWLGNWCKHKIK